MDTPLNGNGHANGDSRLLDMEKDAGAIVRAISERNKFQFQKDLEEFEREKKKSVGKIIQEGVQDFSGMISQSMDMWDFSQDTSLDNWNSYGQFLPPTYRLNQKRGEFLPVYLDENQLRFLRDRSRKLCAENCFALAALENRINYTVGEEGLQVNAGPEKGIEASDPEAQRLIRQTQRVIDKWYQYNDLQKVQEWLISQPDINGDGLVRDFPMSNGMLVHRPVQAEHLRSPTGGAYGPHYSFGIQTDPEDTLTIEGYWIIENPLLGWVPAFVPKDEITHVKRHTDWSAKRGLPLYYSCELLLRSAIDLLRAVISTGVVRAKYAVIRKFTNNVVRGAAQKLINELSDASVPDPLTGGEVSVQRKRFGEVTNASSNMEYEFPGSNLDAGVYEVALQMVLRACAARCHMPEWMFTSDASNASYSSSLVAEAPSTKAFTKLQKNLIGVIATNKVKGRESLAWRQIKHAVNCRILDPDVLKVVALTCKGASIVVRDKAGEAQMNMTYFQLGATSLTQIQQSIDLDPKEIQKQKEQEAIDAAKLAKVQQESMVKFGPPQQIDPMTGQPIPPGMPGMPGDPSQQQGAGLGLGQQNASQGNSTGLAGESGGGSGSTGLGASRAPLFGGVLETTINPRFTTVPGTKAQSPLDKLVPLVTKLQRDELRKTWINANNPEHSFSCVMLLIKDSLMPEESRNKHPINQILNMARRLDDGDLAGDGRCGDSHITVKYGLHTANPLFLVELAKKFSKSIKVKLGKTSIFPAKVSEKEDPEHNQAQRGDESCDIVKIDVDSVELRELNKLISSKLKHTDSFSNYVPHITLGSVKAGTGKKYINWDDVEDVELVFDSMCFEDHQGHKTSISLIHDLSMIGRDRHDYTNNIIKEDIEWLLESGFTGQIHIHDKRGHTYTQYWVNGSHVKAPTHEKAQQTYYALKNSSDEADMVKGLQPKEAGEKHYTHPEDLGDPNHLHTYQKAAVVAQRFHGQGAYTASKTVFGTSAKGEPEHIKPDEHEARKAFGAAIEELHKQQAADQLTLEPVPDPVFDKVRASNPGAWETISDEEYEKLKGRLQGPRDPRNPEQKFSQNFLGMIKAKGEEQAAFAKKEKNAEFIRARTAGYVLHTAFERGATPQQAYQTAATMLYADRAYALGFNNLAADYFNEKFGKKLNPILSGLIGLGLQTLPIASLGYLAYSAARNPLKTLRAAGVVSEKVDRAEYPYKKAINPGLGPVRGYGGAGYGPQYRGGGYPTTAFGVGETPSHLRALKQAESTYNNIDAWVKHHNPEGSLSDNAEQIERALVMATENPGEPVEVPFHGVGETKKFTRQQLQLINQYQGYMDSGGGPIAKRLKVGLTPQDDYVGPGPKVPYGINRGGNTIRVSSGGVSNYQSGGGSPEYSLPISRDAADKALVRKFKRFDAEVPSSLPVPPGIKYYRRAFKNVGKQLRAAAKEAGWSPGELNLSNHKQEFEDALNSQEHPTNNKVYVRIEGLPRQELPRQQVDWIVDWINRDEQMPMHESYDPEDPNELFTELLNKNLVKLDFTGTLVSSEGKSYYFSEGQYTVRPLIETIAEPVIEEVVPIKEEPPKEDNIDRLTKLVEKLIELQLKPQTQPEIKFEPKIEVKIPEIKIPKITIPPIKMPAPKSDPLLQKILANQIKKRRYSINYNDDGSMRDFDSSISDELED